MRQSVTCLKLQCIRSARKAHSGRCFHSRSTTCMWTSVIHAASFIAGTSSLARYVRLLKAYILTTGQCPLYHTQLECIPIERRSISKLAELSGSVQVDAFLLALISLLVIQPCILQHSYCAERHTDVDWRSERMEPRAKRSPT